MSTDAKRKANAKWNQAHTDTITLCVRKGVKNKWKTIAELSGLPLKDYIATAIAQKALADGLITADQAGTLPDEDPEGEWVKSLLP